MTKSETYIFFSPWSKLFLSEFKSLFYLSIPDEFYQSLLLKVEKQLWVCIKYLQKKVSNKTFRSIYRRFVNISLEIMSVT